MFRYVQHQANNNHAEQSYLTHYDLPTYGWARLSTLNFAFSNFYLAVDMANCVRFHYYTYLVYFRSTSNCCSSFYLVRSGLFLFLFNSRS